MNPDDAKLIEQRSLSSRACCGCRGGRAMTVEMAKILHKLRWSSQGEWSAHVTPEECRLLLDRLERLEAVLYPPQPIFIPEGATVVDNRGKPKQWKVDV